MNTNKLILSVFIPVNDSNNATILTIIENDGQYVVAADATDGKTCSEEYTFSCLDDALIVVKDSINTILEHKQ